VINLENSLEYRTRGKITGENVGQIYAVLRDSGLLSGTHSVDLVGMSKIYWEDTHRKRLHLNFKESTEATWPNIEGRISTLSIKNTDGSSSIDFSTQHQFLGFGYVQVNMEGLELEEIARIKGSIDGILKGKLTGRESPLKKQ